VWFVGIEGGRERERPYRATGWFKIKLLVGIIRRMRRDAGAAPEVPAAQRSAESSEVGAFPYRG
jgi:hypothetical protein